MVDEYETRVVNEEILKKMELKNRYSWIRANMMPLLEDYEMKFFDKVSRFCLKMEKECNHAKDDVYTWIPKFGAEGYVTRMCNFPEVDLDWGEEAGMTYEMMRNLCVDMFDPQFNMGMGATVLAVNPVRAHNEGRSICLEALKDMVSGKEEGAILITEPERGSDSLHPLTSTVEDGEGGFVVNGEKAFNTNAPRSKWLVLYGTTDPSNEAESPQNMTQLLIQVPSDGLTIERVVIPWVPKLWLGKETLVDVKVPADQVLGGVGKGRDYQFEGLVPERMGIAILDASECWGALAYAGLYTNMRMQFGKPILTLQGAGFTLCEWWAKTSNYTQGVLRFAEQYDGKMKKYNGELPKMVSQALVAAASQMKYEGAALAERVCYEMANLMGGAGVCDNTLMRDYLGVSRIQEIVGGSRQIQLYVMSMSQRQLFKMI
ncbi:MAG TPA: acyl-CoA dehydrogenase family protein [Candidatus Lokiarchaeia archaeon]|nr:acyl-CoA dehydrogenase family protein [Candidatus Lokiarchaeia archaeon]